MKNFYGNVGNICDPLCAQPGPDIPNDITLEQLKKRYLELFKERTEMQELYWHMERQIDAYRTILKGTL